MAVPFGFACGLLATGWTCEPAPDVCEPDETGRLDAGADTAECGEAAVDVGEPDAACGEPLAGATGGFCNTAVDLFGTEHVGEGGF